MNTVKSLIKSVNQSLYSFNVQASVNLINLTTTKKDLSTDYIYSYEKLVNRRSFHGNILVLIGVLSHKLNIRIGAVSASVGHVGL